MKSLNSMKKLKKEVEKTSQSLLEIISDMKKEVNLNFDVNLKNILEQISDDYDLDFNELEKKYIKKKSKNKKKKASNENDLIDCSSDEDNSLEKLNNKEKDSLMTKAIVNGTECYYETKEGGDIFNKSLQKIGKYEKGKLNLF
jgi:hypothetical protein